MATLKFGNGNWASKKEAVLAYNDENSNFKPLPFTFDRASTATVVNKDGLIETVGADEPRIDFLNNSKGHLLLEPSRSNRLSYSEDFSSWGTSGTVNLTSGIVSPKGDNSAYTVSGTGDLTMSTSLASTGTHIFSIYAKGNIGDTFRVFKSNGFSYSQDTITIDSTDWKRYQFSRDFTSTSGIIFIDNFDEGTISLWGAQLEQGSYATSYIPTQGETNGVTRSAEDVDQTVPSNIFNSNEGVIYTEISSLSNDGTQRRFTFGNANFSNNIRFTYVATDNLFEVNLYNGSDQGKLSFTLNNAVQLNKIAYLYSTNNFQLWVNGVKVDFVNSGTTFSSGTLIRIAQGDSSNNRKFYGNLKDVKIYNELLTDAELIALTSG